MITLSYRQRHPLPLQYRLMRTSNQQTERNAPINPIPQSQSQSPLPNPHNPIPKPAPPSRRRLFHPDRPQSTRTHSPNQPKPEPIKPRGQGQGNRANNEKETGKHNNNLPPHPIFPNRPIPPQPGTNHPFAYPGSGDVCGYSA